jgi:hypothetical protein
MRRSIGNDGALDDLILAGRKIGAIKAYRLATGASLIAARDAIDARTAALRAAGREPASLRLSPAERARFVAVLVMGFAFCAVFAFIIFGGWTLSHTNGTGHLTQ